MNGSELAQVLGSTAALILAVVAYRKWRPERDGVTITNAGKVTEMSLSFADRVDQDNDDLRTTVANMRREIDQYREDTQKHISELNTALRGKVAEVKHLEGEVARRDAAIVERDQQIGELRERVDHLESEVRELKANGGPHSPT